MEVMYLTDPVQTRMFSGSDKNEVFSKRLVYEFQSGRRDGYFLSDGQEKAYQDWLKTLKEENICYHATDRLHRKTIKYDTLDTLFLQVKSFDLSFDGCAGFLTFEDESMKNAYIDWLQKRNARFTTLYKTWRDNRK